MKLHLCQYRWKYLVVIFASLFSVACTDPEAAKKQEALAKGEQTVKQTCFVCHGQGINGAPIIGNVKMWGARVEKGKDALMQSALNGKGDMPIKGGNPNLSDEDISLAIDYMISQLP